MVRSLSIGTQPLCSENLFRNQQLTLVVCFMNSERMDSWGRKELDNVDDKLLGF